MTNLFVPHELAVKLRDKGFNESCLGYYENDNDSKSLLVYYFNIIPDPNEIFIVAPLWQQVIDWLREEKKLHLLISETNTGSWHVYVKKIGKSDEYALVSAIGPNYYSAVRLSIEKVLELI